MDLVDDIDLVASADRGELNAADDFLADVLDARAAGRVHLVDVGVRALGDGEALFAFAVGRGRRTFLAQERFRQQARHRGLSRAARAAEEIGVAHAIGFERVLDRAFDMDLAHDVVERLRAILPIERLCHRNLPSP